MRERRIRHDGDPVLAWCIGNVVGHYDARSNVYPRREDVSRKIDCAVATIMALAVSITDKKDSDYIYREHGLCPMTASGGQETFAPDFCPI